MASRDMKKIHYTRQIIIKFLQGVSSLPKHCILDHCMCSRTIEYIPGAFVVIMGDPETEVLESDDAVGRYIVYTAELQKGKNEIILSPYVIVK